MSETVLYYNGIRMSEQCSIITASASSSSGGGGGGGRGRGRGKTLFDEGNI